jgi:coiled-coil domain-containing protein 63/114
MEAKKGQGAKQEFANPIEILTIRVNSVISKNIEKKRLLDQYVRNAKIIAEAFETIMEATGINNIDEIVTSFIKAEEQNVQLFNYVDQLNQENDSLEESNRQYDLRINHYSEMAKMNDDTLNQRN